MSSPNNRIDPEVGRCSRIISRSRTDLPEPLPPAMAKISPRRTSRSRSVCTAWLPKRVQTLRISITRSGVPAADVMSEVQDAERDREQRVGHDHEEDRLDDAERRLVADAVGAAAGAKALKATDERDDEREDERLADADEQCRALHLAAETIGKFVEADAELRTGHDHAAEDLSLIHI